MERRCRSEEQIIGILKEHQARLGAKELCRKHAFQFSYSGVKLGFLRGLPMVDQPFGHHVP